MPFSREIGRILFGILFVMALIGGAAAYWAIAGRNTILQRGDNPRLIEAMTRIQRGGIYDRHQRPLVETVNDANGIRRQYLKPSTYSLVGYYSLRYGAAGAEAAFNQALNGLTETPNLADYFAREILHIPPVGADIQLTLDVDIQDILVQKMRGYHGAAVVMNAQNGELLALASLPSYDPNTLDDDWDTLTEADGKPFFNRALQGQYQPGGIMYTLWLTQAILSDYPLSRPFSQAADAMVLGDEITVECVIQPPAAELSLVDAFIYGCPAAFVSYQRNAAANSYDDLAQAYSLDNPITLAGFPIPEPIAPTADVRPEAAALRDALGQGDLTATPLHLAGMMAAIAGNGNAPTPTIEQGRRLPGASEWTSQPRSPTSIPMMTAAAARQLQGILQRAWMTLQDKAYPAESTVGGHIAMSQSGDGAQIWLNGFAAHVDRDTAAFVILLEDTSDIQALIAIGQSLIDVLLS